MYAQNACRRKDPDMKINDASRSTGVSRDMIRFYEKLGLVRPGRLPNGYRDYTDDDLYQLTVIRYLSNLGVPLKVISKAFSSGQTDLLVGNLHTEIDRLTLLKTQIDARIAAARESIDCFNMMASGTPWEMYETQERYLFSFGNQHYPVYRSAPEEGDSFVFYYRQRYSVGEEITPLGPADRGIMFYSSLPGTECVPSQRCLRTVLTHPSGSNHLLGAGELEPFLREAASLTGQTEFTVLIHQFFRQTGSNDAAILCAEILPG